MWQAASTTSVVDDHGPSGGAAGLAQNTMAGARLNVQTSVGVFKMVIGEFPFKMPNVDISTKEKTHETIADVIPNGGESSDVTWYVARP